MVRPARESRSPSARLRARFEEHRLTPTQRRIAQFLIENAQQAAYLSSNEVAELVNVSQASVTRLAIALGFEGYPQLRRYVRELDLASPPAGDDTSRNELQHAVAGEIANLRRLESQLADRDTVRRAATLLAGTRPLPVLGLRASRPVAHYFAYFAAKVLPDVRLLPDGGTSLGDGLEQARAAGASALLVFALPRYPRETVAAMRAARDLGLQLVTLTDSELAPVADLADVVLPAAVGSQLVFDSQAAPMLLAMVLLQEICAVEPGSTQHRLEAFERSAAARQIFEP
ncbi:MurR/RpiR family transcriptional regulator [Saccharopolyspora rosea]|uniref:MurR/RpiR family transcriptional regulator n=1 Tax=Saccharopolyspora rosea TaxID=524884 RepID=A0ABW3G145_9PSEU